MLNLLFNKKIEILFSFIIFLFIPLISASTPIVLIEKGNHTRLDNLNWSVSGHIFDTNLNMSDYNITANYFFGNGQYLTGVSDYYPSSINLTTETYNGSLTYGTQIGYAAGNAICNASFLGSHLCDASEIPSWFANIINPNINDDAWIINFGPGYIPASIPLDDCLGFTYSGITTHLGNYYHFNSTRGGEGRAINCATLLKLCCASYT